MVPDPHKLAHTIEDPQASPEERACRFGQADHVRLYGADFPGRLQATGFTVEIWTAGERDPAMCQRWRFDPKKQVFIARKSASGLLPLAMG